MSSDDSTCEQKKRSVITGSNYPSSWAFFSKLPHPCVNYSVQMNAYGECSYEATVARHFYSRLILPYSDTLKYVHMYYTKSTD